MIDNLPKIVSFIWNPFEGGIGEIKWSVVNSDKTLINRKITPNSGSLLIDSKKDSNWNIEAHNMLGMVVSATLKIPEERPINFSRIKSFTSNKINVYSGEKIELNAAIFDSTKLSIKKKIENEDWEDVLTIEENNANRKTNLILNQNVNKFTEYWLKINDSNSVEGNEIVQINLIEPLKLSFEKETPDYNPLINKVKHFLRDAKLNEAFEILMSISATIGSIENEIYILNFRTSSIGRDFLLGLITYEEYKVERTRIVLAMLKLIEDL